MKVKEFELLKQQLLDSGTITQKQFGNCVQGDVIFVRQSEYPLSQRKLESLKRIAEVQKYYQCNPVRFIRDWFGVELLDSQAWIIQQAWTCPNVLLVASRGFGKALDLETNIPTPTGDRKLRDIHTGDYVFGDDGFPTKVINESPIYVNHNCYKVTFADGQEIIADKDHLWQLDYCGRSKVVTTEEISKNYKKWRERKDPTKNGYEYVYKNTLCNPVEYEEKDLKIDPYILGLWLGDGNSVESYISVGKDDLQDTVNRILETGYQIYSINNDSGGNKKVTIRTPDNIPLIVKLREYNLFGNKHIPEDYIYGSVEQRLELVRGLMDTDGTVSKNGQCTFVQCDDHKDIVFDLRKIIQSLGFKVAVYHKTKMCDEKQFWCYEIYFTCDKKLPLVKMSRKFERLREKRYPAALHKSIVNIEPVQSVPVKCLMVDNDSHLYLCGDCYTITHNSTIIDILTMAKDMLFSNYWTYIASGSGSQAEQTFTTLERLANDNIDSFMGSTFSLFKNEIVINNAAGDGFSHSSNGFNYGLYNGSYTQTLNSNVDKMIVHVKLDKLRESPHNLDQLQRDWKR